MPVYVRPYGLDGGATCIAIVVCFVARINIVVALCSADRVFVAFSSCHLLCALCVGQEPQRFGGSLCDASVRTLMCSRTVLFDCSTSPKVFIRVVCRAVSRCGGERLVPFCFSSSFYSLRLWPLSVSFLPAIILETKSFAALLVVCIAVSVFVHFAFPLLVKSVVSPSIAILLSELQTFRRLLQSVVPCPPHRCCSVCLIR